MKVLFLFPPQWSPISPHFALMSLTGQLYAAGFDCKIKDLNIDFYNHILKKEYLQSAILKAVDGQTELLDEIKPHLKPGADFKSYPLNIQNKMVKYGKIKEYVEKKQGAFFSVPEEIETAISITKDKEKFYEPENLVKAINLIDIALEMASLPYFPSKMSLDNYSNPFLKLNYESIKHFVFDKETNVFIDYYQNILEDITNENADYIGISINSSSQIIPGLTLAHMLKTKTKAHINIGGNFFGRVKDILVNKPEFFELFCDTLLVQEGEKPIIELAKHVNGEISIEEVSNILYKNGDKIIINKTKTPMKLNEMQNMRMEGLNPSDYFAPKIVMPYQTSRGCYWGKCSFCDQGFGVDFNEKDVEKLILEFKELKEKYGIDSYEFIDESVSPEYLKKLATRLIEENLNIEYFMDARLESEFDFETLNLAHKSGLKMVLWGLESGSDAVMKMINKGIDIKRRFEILKNSSDADIWNFAFIFFGFPTETVEDAQKTIDMIVDNKEIIHSYGRSVFTMGKHTRLKENPENYGIVEIYPNEDEFSPSYGFKAVGMEPSQLEKMTKKCTESCLEAYGRPLWMYLRYREYLFLYLSKHGTKWVKDCKLEL